MGTNDCLTVAVAQAPSPNIADAMESACELVMDAGQAGARLVVLPEAFIPGYPDWIWTTSLGDTQALLALKGALLSAAVSVPSETTDKLGRMAQRAGLDLVVGVCEHAVECGSPHLYNALLFIDVAGRLIGHQRQLAPAPSERIVFSSGDGRPFGAYAASVGAIGGLIGADNHLPLARYVLYAAGVQIYVAVAHNTNAAWLAALRHIASEGRVYVIGCAGSGSGVSVSPDGELHELEPHADARLQLGVIDLGRVAAARHLDPEGPLARPDVFQLQLHPARVPVPLWLKNAQPLLQAKTRQTVELPAVVPL